MRPAVHISSLANPRIAAVLRLRKQRERAASGLFIAEGRREVCRALVAGLRLRELYWSPRTSDADDADVLAALPELARAGDDFASHTVTPAVMGKLSYGENESDVLAVFDQPRWKLSDLARGPSELWLVAVGTQKPGNLGAMARSAEAAGASGVLVAEAVVDAFNPNAIRASTGAVLSLPIVAAEAEELLEFLAAGGCRLYAATPDAELDYTEADLTGPVALVIGPEDRGLGPTWLERAQRWPHGGGRVSIPMHGQTVDSLNASVEAAVLLFEAVRQRRAIAH